MFESGFHIVALPVRGRANHERHPQLFPRKKYGEPEKLEGGNGCARWTGACWDCPEHIAQECEYGEKGAK